MEWTEPEILLGLRLFLFRAVVAAVTPESFEKHSH